MPEITNIKTGEKYNVTKEGLELIRSNKDMVGMYDFGDNIKTPSEAKHLEEGATVNPKSSSKK